MKEKELLRLTEMKKIEDEIYKSGIKLIGGIDEAGRGPLAGPVVVACAVMPKDSMNILNATKFGLTSAVKNLKIKPDMILVDALTNIDTCRIPYKSIIKGDAKCYSIACASIIAKVTRDRIMRQWAEIYPQYGFEKHKGYGTKMHIDAIKEYGLCPLHRNSFVKNIVD